MPSKRHGSPLKNLRKTLCYALEEPKQRADKGTRELLRVNRINLITQYSDQGTFPSNRDY